MKSSFAILCLCLQLAAGAPELGACTNILVTKGASKDGSTMIAYSADALGFYGELYFRAGGLHQPGETRPIVDWESGNPRGQIPEAPVTYRRVGNINEFQVVIGESTFGGRMELEGPSGLIDYGSLIYITLERAKTAREAIQIMTDLVERYGYASSGESFSIADKNEVWMMEMIGKGYGKKGAVWVAVRIPDGTIAAHANQARIRKFPQNDPENCLFSKDLIPFARECGYFSGNDKDFSFAKAFAPLDYGALRDCEARVWSIFNRAAKGAKISADFVKAVPGSNPMPLFVKPDQPLDVHDVMQLMRDHYEGTEFDLNQGVGAGPYELPYRCRPLSFMVEGKNYVHERSISTYTTGWSFVSQSRAWLPDPIGGLLWFGVDDTYTTCYFPAYCGISRVSKNWAEGAGSTHEFNWDSAFWVTNAVSNWAYSRWDAIFPDVQRVQRETENEFLDGQATIEAQAKQLFEQDPVKARAFLTDYSARQGTLVYTRYKDLFGHLLWKFMDFGKRDVRGYPKPLPDRSEILKRIVEERGASMQVKELDPSLDQ